MAHLPGFLLATARRATLLLVIFVLASVAIFSAVRAVPGDPIALRLKNPDPARVAAERLRLGLDDPLPQQWWRYVSTFWKGEWGRSFTSGRLVRNDVAEFLPATLELSLAGLLLGVAGGILLTAGAEGLRLKTARRISHALGMLGLAVPIFWIGLLALWVGSLWLGWFPAGGRFDAASIPPPSRTGFLTLDAMLAGDPRSLGVAIRHLALPALCLSVFQTAYVCAVLQARLRDSRLRTLLISLRARGLGPLRLWLQHVARVVSPPVIAVIGTNFGALLGGAVLTETVFSWPGLGRYLVAAVLERDLFVLENVLLLVVLLVVGVVFLTDLLATMINPVATRAQET